MMEHVQKKVHPIKKKLRMRFFAFRWIFVGNIFNKTNIMGNIDPIYIYDSLCTSIANEGLLMIFNVFIKTH